MDKRPSPAKRSYGKQFLEGKSYSNADNSLDGVDWPALSFLGETTPSTFLECLTPDMMGDGFMSRFLTITYEGDRPPPNRERYAQLDPADLEMWRALVTHMLGFQYPINMPEPCTVQPDAYLLMRRDGTVIPSVLPEGYEINAEGLTLSYCGPLVRH